MAKAKPSLRIRLILDEEWQFDQLVFDGMPGSKPIRADDRDLDQKHFLALLHFGLHLHPQKDDWPAALISKKSQLVHALENGGANSLIQKRNNSAFQFFGRTKDDTGESCYEALFGDPDPPVSTAIREPWRALFRTKGDTLVYRSGLRQSPRLTIEVRDGNGSRELDTKELEIAIDVILAHQPNPVVAEEVNPGSSAPVAMFANGSKASVYLFGVTAAELASAPPHRAILIQYSGVNSACTCAMLALHGFSFDLWLADPARVKNEYQRKRILHTVENQLTHWNDIAVKNGASIRLRFYCPSLASPRAFCVPGVRTALGWYLPDTLQSDSTVDGHSAPMFVVTGPEAHRTACEEFIVNQLERLLTRQVLDEDGEVVSRKQALGEWGTQVRENAASSLADKFEQDGD